MFKFQNKSVKYFMNDMKYMKSCPIQLLHVCSYSHMLFFVPVLDNKNADFVSRLWPISSGELWATCLLKQFDLNTAVGPMIGAI